MPDLEKVSPSPNEGLLTETLHSAASMLADFNLAIFLDLDRPEVFFFELCLARDRLRKNPPQGGIFWSKEQLSEECGRIGGYLESQMAAFSGLLAPRKRQLFLASNQLTAHIFRDRKGRQDYWKEYDEVRKIAYRIRLRWYVSPTT